MPYKPEPAKSPKVDPPAKEEKEETPPAGEGEAANDQEMERKGEEEETFPMEEGFSIVP